MDATELDSEVIDLMRENDDRGTVAWVCEILEVSGAEAIASFERLVAAGEIEPGSLYTDHGGVTHETWNIKHPPPDAFILAVAKAISPLGEAGLHVHSNYNGDCLDYDVVLEPSIPRKWYTTQEAYEEARERDIKMFSHRLRFRQIVEWGGVEGGPWICFLESHGQCYEQGTLDEDDEENWTMTPEAAYQSLLDSFSEEITNKVALREKLVGVLNA